MDYDFIIIGAGVTGLSAAEALSSRNYRVLVIEKENRIGTGVSSRNSEVIHAGIYYPKDSLKSILCIRGKHLLYDWCGKKNVAYQKIGKFIIASDSDEIDKLESIRQNACNAGMEDLHFISAEKVAKTEPEVYCTDALFSSTSGIVSAHELMDSLKLSAENNGADFLFLSKVNGITKNSQSNGYIVEITDSSNEKTQIEVNGIINCAGLYTDVVSEILGINDPAYKLKFVKGNYFKLIGKGNPFSHLIYPVPVPRLRGLGIHVTLDLNHHVKFGPDIEEMPNRTEDYSVNEARLKEFYYSIKKYYPAIKPENLAPEMTGIRPRLTAEKDFNDFIINEESRKGFPNVINCIGIESPGLTACLAIGEYISNKLI